MGHNRIDRHRCLCCNEGVVEQKQTEPGTSESIGERTTDSIPPEDVQAVIDVLYDGQERPTKPDVNELLNPDAVNPGPEDIVSDSSSKHPDSRRFSVSFFKTKGNRGGRTKD